MIIGGSRGLLLSVPFPSSQSTIVKKSLEGKKEGLEATALGRLTLDTKPLPWERRQLDIVKSEVKH